MNRREKENSEEYSMDHFISKNPSKEKNEWKCQSCTYVNLKNETVCEVCNIAKGETVSHQLTEMYQSKATKSDIRQDDCKQPIIENRCFLCGESKNNKCCAHCQNKMFCFYCENQYHNHPSRKWHLKKTNEKHDDSTFQDRMSKQVHSAFEEVYDTMKILEALEIPNVLASITAKAEHSKILNISAYENNREKEWENELQRVQKDFHIIHERLWQEIGTVWINDIQYDIESKIASNERNDVEKEQCIKKYQKDCHLKAEGMRVLWESKKQTDLYQYQKALKADWDKETDKHIKDQLFRDHKLFTAEIQQLIGSVASKMTSFSENAETPNNQSFHHLQDLKKVLNFCHETCTEIVGEKEKLRRIIAALEDLLLKQKNEFTKEFKEITDAHTKELSTIKCQLQDEIEKFRVNENEFQSISKHATKWKTQCDSLTIELANARKEHDYFIKQLQQLQIANDKLTKELQQKKATMTKISAFNDFENIQPQPVNAMVIEQRNWNHTSIQHSKKIMQQTESNSSSRYVAVLNSNLPSAVYEEPQEKSLMRETEVVDEREEFDSQFEQESVDGQFSRTTLQQNKRSLNTVEVNKILTQKSLTPTNSVSLNDPIMDVTVTEQKSFSIEGMNHSKLLIMSNIQTDINQRPCSITSKRSGELQGKCDVFATSDDIAMETSNKCMAASKNDADALLVGHNENNWQYDKAINILIVGNLTSYSSETVIKSIINCLIEDNTEETFNKQLKTEIKHKTFQEYVFSFPWLKGNHVRFIVSINRNPYLNIDYIQPRIIDIFTFLNTNQIQDVHGIIFIYNHLNEELWLLKNVSLLHRNLMQHAIFVNSNSGADLHDWRVILSKRTSSLYLNENIFFKLADIIFPAPTLTDKVKTLWRQLFFAFEGKPSTVKESMDVIEASSSIENIIQDLVHLFKDMASNSQQYNIYSICSFNSAPLEEWVRAHTQENRYIDKLLAFGLQKETFLIQNTILSNENFIQDLYNIISTYFHKYPEIVINIQNIIKYHYNHV